ncbi:hypothetical protein [Chitinophaga sp. S165]|uniref:phosphoribosyltransferase-like protein n=1 Tax=Chitinophaga sp. S165 TaxID=2135462 RepID=UPI000D713BE9|nr:hypothetical protein [Chitinophaga sp. S165]PWV44627.1 hypothetical protein C7475_1195 [Chitinophaga sp. S165]
MKDTESIRALTKIFKEKEWFSKDSESLVYESFCDLLEVLAPDERKLLIELTHRYFWIAGNEYEKHITDVIKDIPDEILVGIKKLLLFPVIKPTDEGRAKSGTGLVYDIRAMMPKLTKMKNISPFIIDEFQSFSRSLDGNLNILLCLVDDFIGTGDTLDQCLEEIKKFAELKLDRTVIVSISCQKETYDKLRAEGVRIFSKYIIERGITDFNEQPFIEEKKALMRSIEKQIPGASSFSLGFQESEAIITLKRTPDNTFPIFWKKLRRNGKYFDAPFLRED